MTWEQKFPPSRAGKERLIGQLVMQLQGAPAAQQQRQPSSTPAGKAPAQAQAEWTCGKCQLNNWESRTNCRSCRSLKPGYRPPGSPSRKPPDSKMARSKPAPAVAVTKPAKDATSENMDTDDGLASIDADPHWTGMSIAELKSQATQLESLAKQLKTAGMSSSADEVLEKLHILRNYTRSRLPVCQRLDNLSALLKKNQKARESMEAKQIELHQQLEELGQKLVENKEEEASLTKQLDEERQALVPDTVVDSPNVTSPTLPMLQEAMAKAKTELTQSLGTVDANQLPLQLGPMFDQVMYNMMKSLTPEPATMNVPTGAPPVTAQPIPDAATLPASEQELAAAMQGGQQLPNDGYGACPKTAPALPSPYAKGTGKNGSST